MTNFLTCKKAVCKSFMSLKWEKLKMRKYWRNAWVKGLNTKKCILFWTIKLSGSTLTIFCSRQRKWNISWKAKRRWSSLLNYIDSSFSGTKSTQLISAISTIMINTLSKICHQNNICVYSNARLCGRRFNFWTLSKKYRDFNLTH